MKPSKSSLYREIENLLLWFIPVGNNLPKDFALRSLGERMLNDLVDALNTTALALQTQDIRQRLELINLVKLKGVLEKELGLTLHPDKVYIQHAKKGVKFVGSVILPKRIYLSNRTVGRMYSMMEEMDEYCRNLNLKDLSIDTLCVLEHYVCACNSYMGFLKYNNSYALRRRLFGSLRYFWRVAYISGHFDKVTLRKRFRLDERLLKLYNCKTIKKKKYGNQVFLGVSRKSRKRANKKNS